jgi:hypothetical protein
MDVREAANELTVSLENLETAILSPVVSGELAAWARTVQEATMEVARQLPSFIRSVLHPQYAEIAKTDQELLTRVQQLKDEDHKLLEELQAFEGHVKAFAERAAKIMKDELQLEGDRAKLEQQGTALSLNIKRQRAAADTWLAEAAYRDRGPVD